MIQALTGSFWAITSTYKGFSDISNGAANYNTYALGRDGYFSLNLVTPNGKLNADKPIISFVLGSLAYEVGKRYEDYSSATDHDAEYGLAALVGGIVRGSLLEWPVLRTSGPGQIESFQLDQVGGLMRRSRWAKGLYLLGLFWAANQIFKGDQALITGACMSLFTACDIRFWKA